ncbi:unnamed protein product, partial [Gulo gulo]
MKRKFPHFLFHKLHFLSRENNCYLCVYFSVPSYAILPVYFILKVVYFDISTSPFSFRLPRLVMDQNVFNLQSFPFWWTLKYFPN